MVAIVGGIDEGSSGCVDGVCVEALRLGNGELLVGPGFTNFSMSSGVFVGVTLSMNCHAGSSSTMELWSEWSGTGISDAESMSF